jgi:hypothetical protein
MIRSQTKMNPEAKICVIGAGPCGIAVAKNLLEEGLTQFVVFEKNQQVGGNWIFNEQGTHSSVYETTHIISSKRLSEYEDFPMPSHYPDYPSHRQILSYFNDYAEHFGLKSYIRFNTEVLQVNLLPQNQWQVIYQYENEKHEERFDYLFVANGHHWDPLMPEHLNEFTGTVLHAHDYKRAEPFRDQRVLVIGGGNSACDIAVEIARISPKTCISIRNGQHIFPKFIFGKPTDIAFNTIEWMPFWCKQQLTRLVLRMIQGRYAKYQLKNPDTKPLATHPTINSELLYFIRHGKVLPRKKIESIEGNCVYFVDGEKDIFDTIICATGYKISFPFFSKSLIDFSKLSHIPLYLKMLHPQLPHLFFIGLFQPQGCIWPLADYQAKIAAGMISGRLKNRVNLLPKIKKERKTARRRYHSSPRHVLEVEYGRFRKQLLSELR